MGEPTSWGRNDDEVNVPAKNKKGLKLQTMESKPTCWEQQLLKLLHCGVVEPTSGKLEGASSCMVGDRNLPAESGTVATPTCWSGESSSNSQLRG